MPILGLMDIWVTTMPTVLYVAERGTPTFEAGRMTVDLVCAGDSITGRTYR